MVALLLLGQLPPVAQDVLQAAGGILLIYLASVAFRQWRSPSKTEAKASAPRTLFQAALVNLLNPNPYLGWTLILGPSVHRASAEHTTYAIGLIASFYGTMVVMLAGFILVVGTASFLGSRTQRALVGVSATVLAGLGIYLLATAVWNLGSA